MCLVAGFTLRRMGFDPRPLHINFVVDDVRLRPDSVWILRPSPLKSLHHLSTFLYLSFWIVIKQLTSWNFHNVVSSTALSLKNKKSCDSSIWVPSYSSILSLSSEDEQYCARCFFSSFISYNSSSLAHPTAFLSDLTLKCFWLCSSRLRFHFKRFTLNET